MESVVFTNGCFDLLHPGHVDLLKKARALGTRLVVGINSDESARRIKGRTRPFLDQNARAALLRELRCVDEVRIFGENTPERLIKEVKPDVLVKGGDWAPAEIVGADFVLKNGGEVFSIPFEEDFSSTKLAEKIKSSGENSSAGASAPENSPSATGKYPGGRLKTFENILRRELSGVSKTGDLISETLTAGNEVWLCGGGGGADRAAARYVASELREVVDSPGDAFESNAPDGGTKFTTPVTRDSSLKIISPRRVGGLVKKGDLLICLASGNSDDLPAASMKAREVSCRTIAVCGTEGRKLAALCDESILIPAEGLSAARVREAILFVGHLWREVVGEKIELSEEARNG